MTLPIAFVGCETSHLSVELGEAWEVAVILREFEAGQHTDTEYVWQIRVRLATADPKALEVGRYLERFAVPPHAEAAFTAHESGHVTPMTRAEAVAAIVNLLSGAVLVGNNPAFDERFLSKLVGPGGAQWHYRPYDIVQLAAIRLGVPALEPLPWSSRALSRAVGVEPPGPDTAHTALGDARWARDVHDAVMVKAQVPLTWEGRAQHAISLYTKAARELEDDRRTLSLTSAAVERAQKLASRWAVLRAYGGAATELRAALATPAKPGVTSNHHYGRAWAGHEIEDACPCIKAPCGLVAQSVPECAQHRADKSTRQSHPADDCPALEGTSAPVMAGEHIMVPRTEREHWVDIADALNAAGAAGMPVGIDLDGTLTDHNAWSVVWNREAERWTVAGYDDDIDLNDDQDEDDEEFDETGDSDGDVLDLISDIAARLSDATDEGEYHAVGLIGDLANGRKTCHEAREELAQITFRHV